MKNQLLIDVIIPVFNEQDSIGLVINDIPNLVRDIIVVNNGSTDKTADNVRLTRATLIDEPQKGYGKACLTGIEYIKNKSIAPDVVVFLDGDYSDFPEEIHQLIQPIITSNYDLVIGSRNLGQREKGAITPQQIFGNWLATFLLRILYNGKFTDLGPFRAIKYEKLMKLNMKDQNFGWTIEMQIKALKNKLKYTEIPVKYRVRIGQSKVSGTLVGAFSAGYKILYTIFKYL